MPDGIALNPDGIAVKPDEFARKLSDAFGIPDADAMIQDGRARKRKAIASILTPFVVKRERQRPQCHWAQKDEVQLCAVGFEYFQGVSDFLGALRTGRLASGSARLPSAGRVKHKAFPAKRWGWIGA